MDTQQLQDDVREGRISTDRLIELIAMLGKQLHNTQQQLQLSQQQLESLQQELQNARQEIDELRRKLGAATPKLDEPFSVGAEEKRQAQRAKKTKKSKRSKRRGRLSRADKAALISRTEQVFPAGAAPEECQFSHSRLVWRLEHGQAVLVAYDVYRRGKNQYGRIPGALGRSEFGLEIIVAVAYQVYIVGLSFDKVCLLMNFFQNLPLKKSQVDALLKQLAKHWEGEFDTLCTLLANSLVVHTDETSWSINSVWAFLSEKVRLLFFGVHKDAATLAQILAPATFAGLVISDDAAVYRNFTHSQKCWAHLLRKAIKLTLLEPHNADYRQFTDRLLEIYRTAQRVQRDRRLSDAGRARKVAELDDEILALCFPVWSLDLPPSAGPANDFRLLNGELMRLMFARQLFVFVTAAAVEQPGGESVPVPGTNNEAERTLRGAALARQTGRTNKTLFGARCRTVIVSVLESLRGQLACFTLSSAIEEIMRWQATGRSLFCELLEKLNLSVPEQSLLEYFFPAPAPDD